MKKIAAFLMTLMALIVVTNALAGGFWYEDGKWWYMDNDGALHPTTSDPLSWKTQMANYNFPETVIRDVSDISTQYNGTPVGCLGLTPTAGSNLRSVPNIDGNPSYDQTGRQEYNHQTIIRKLHGNVTIYVYFSFFDSKGDEWYYVTCADGQEGLLLAKRIQLISME